MSMMRVTIDSKGIAREDKYWLLKSDKNQKFVYNDDGHDIDLIPVQREACNLEQYKNAPDLRRQLNRWAQSMCCVLEPESVHGRRINDEVELFEMEDGKV